MVPRVERTAAPKRATHAPKKEKAKSNTQIFNYGDNSNQPEVHTVEQKETAFSIAKKYNITIHDLAAANGWKYIDKQLVDSQGNVISLLTGTKIKLPHTTDTKETPSQDIQKNNGKTYPVKKGDNFVKIAEANNISIRQLAAANGLTVKQDKNGIKVLKKGQPAILSIGETLKIPASVTTNLANIENFTGVRKRTGMSEGFQNVIQKFEGDPKNNYQPHTLAYQDDNGVWTVGYGETKDVKEGTERDIDEAYREFAKNYLQIQEDLRIELGDATFNKIPQSIREGVIDLIFNKGFEALNINKFKQSVDNNDTKGMVEQLIFTKSIKTGEDMSGLYKRSLARIAMVYNNLDSENKQKIKPLIDNFYATAKNKVSENELKQWWNLDKSTGNPQQYVVKSGESGFRIAQNHGISLNELQKANPNIDLNTLKVGDKLVIPHNSKSTKTVTKPPKNNALTNKINALKLGNKNSYNQVLAQFNNYAKTYKLPQRAIDIFKEEIAEEYDSWLYINYDNMRAMAGILESKKTDELVAAIKTALKASDKTHEFAGLALKSKITKDNAKDLIKAAGGAKEYVTLVKKTGNFEIMKHTLVMLLGKNQDKNLLARFNKAEQENNYKEIINIYNQVLAKNPQEISKQLAHTLDKEDDLNSELYKYQIGKVNDKNILQVLKSNDIIAKICEAENNRSQCKNEILKLLKILENNYRLNPKKKQEFVQLINSEFRERSINPMTWWVGTSKISKAFNNLISNVKPIKKEFTIKDAEQTLFKSLGLQNGTETLSKLTDKNGNVKPYIKVYTPEPNKKGKLSGKRIVINAGHGGYNPNGKGFDKGALGTNAGTKIQEWSLNRYMADKVIKELLNQGAEVVLTSGHVNNVSYLNLKADMTISLHADSHNGTSGPRLYSHKQDENDKILADKILNKFLSSKHVAKVTNLKRADKMHTFEMQTNATRKKSMQIVSNDSNLQILKRDKKNPSKEPSILIEYCNMQQQDEIIDIVTGNLGKDIVKSIVDGIIDYWK